ncbi:MAG: hypothetical protein RL223_1702 [Pseudomonadota bacterium]
MSHPTDTVVLPLDLGPADGPAVMVKDTIDVAGTPTRAGSPALADAAAAPRHAAVVQRLLDAGWHLTGKTALHELAYGTTGINHHLGTPLNPRWPDRVPGGSSSGSAVAVARGRVPVAIGTDTGGSIRTPAACCGVFGLKPGFGRVSRAGVMPADSSLDCVGPLAVDMDALVRAMQALAPDFGDLPTLPATLRLGWLDIDAPAAAEAALRQVADAAGALGHTVERLRLPLFEAAYDAGLVVINHENWPALSPLLEGGRIGADVAARLRRAAATTDTDRERAEAVRTAFRTQVDAALRTCDVLMLPTLVVPPPRVTDAADTQAAVAMTRSVRPFNLSGHPALTLPLDDADGLPVGLQLVGRLGDDETLCAIGRHLAAELGLRARPCPATG